MSVRTGKRIGSQNFFQIFFHVLQATLDGGVDGPFRHTFCGSNRFDRVVQQIALKHPLALCVRQTIQCMADMLEAFHALDQFLRRRVREASRIFNAVLGIQRVVRLIAIDTTAAGLNVPLTRQQFFRNFFRDFDHNIFHIPRVKFPQIDFLHCVPPFRCWGLTSDRSGGRRRAAPGLDFGPSWPEAKQKKCARTARRYADA